MSLHHLTTLVQLLLQLLLTIGLTGPLLTSQAGLLNDNFSLLLDLFHIKCYSAAKPTAEKGVQYSWAVGVYV